MTKFLFTILLICVTISSINAQTICQYNYKKTITINGNRIVGGPHTNFPILISHTDPNLRVAAGRVTNANGYDIIFGDANGNPLDFELESYNSGTGNYVGWVKIPTITSGVNVTIQMFYGNSNITTNQSTVNTWSAGYQGVWHMNGVVDNSDKSITSVNNGSTDVAGYIGRGRNFTRPNHWIELTNFPNLTGNFTISGWIRTGNRTQTGQRIFCDDRNNNGGYALSLGDPSAGTLRFFSRGSNPVSLDAPAGGIANNTWYHVAAVADITNRVKRIYINGVQVASGTFTNAWGTDAGNASIGGEVNGSGEEGNRFNGLLDEIRVASSALSAGWLATEYNSHIQTTTTLGVITAGDFYTVNAEQSIDTDIGNPAVFGNNVWNVYAYDGNNFQNYRGYYIHNTLDFDTRDIWTPNTSPSNATGYVGCSVPNDNHSFRYKRRGFDCGYYQLDMPCHDDDIRLYVNGVQVYARNGWFGNNAFPNIWRGYLDENAEVEFTIREFTGGSNGCLSFNYLNGPNNGNEAVWNGATNTNWFNTNNWCGSAPSTIISAIIPANTPNQPTIDAVNAVVNNLTILNGAVLTITGTNTLDVHGNWTNNGNFVFNNSTVRFLGNGNRTIGGFAAQTSFRNITINNNVINNAYNIGHNIRITGTLNLQNGVVNPNGNLITINATGNSTGGSANSYINGLLRKVGRSTFTFHIGHNGVYAPISISAPAQLTDAFDASYFNADPNANYPSINRDPSLAYISTCEYWILDRTTGTSTVSVSFPWSSANSCPLTQESHVRIARWDGAMWRDHGNAAFSGDDNNKNFTSEPIANFSPFTIGSIADPLPIDLVLFEAKPEQSTVSTRWVTSSEKNNDFFTLERSIDGSTFEIIAFVEGAGNSSEILEYTTVDENPYNGTSYYRLKQTDYDGQFEYSSVVTVNLKKSVDVTIYPNPASDYINIEKLNTDSITEIELYNDFGQLVYFYETGNDTHKIFTGDLPNGLYLLHLIQNGESYTHKIVVAK